MGWDTSTQIRARDRCSNMERFGDYMSSSPLTLIQVVRHKNAVRDYKCKASELENSIVYRITRCIYSRQELKDEIITLYGFSLGGRIGINIIPYLITQVRFRTVGQYLKAAKAWKSLARLTSEYPLVERTLSCYILQHFVHILFFIPAVSV